MIGGTHGAVRWLDGTWVVTSQPYNDKRAKGAQTVVASVGMLTQNTARCVRDAVVGDRRGGAISCVVVPGPSGIHSECGNRLAWRQRVVKEKVPWRATFASCRRCRVGSTRPPDTVA